MQVLFVTAWMFIGALIALLMVRRGHSPWLWWILIPCGPLLGLLALNAKEEEGTFSPTRVRDGQHGSGTRHVLIGVDGHDPSLAACTEVVHELGSSIDTITLAAVLDYDLGQTEPAELRIHEAEAWLQQAAAAVVAAGGPAPDAVVLVGSPADELAALAEERDVDVIAVGQRSHNLLRHLVAGSTARGVSERTPCPVLIVPESVHASTTTT